MVQLSKTLRPMWVRGWKMLAVSSDVKKEEDKEKDTISYG